MKKGVRELRRCRLTSAREAYDLARGLGIHWLLPTREESEGANRGTAKDVSWIRSTRLVSPALVVD